MTLDQFRQAVEGVSITDWQALEALIEAHGNLVRAIRAGEEATELYRIGQLLEQKALLGRAKLRAESEELYQTGFLLRAFAADLPKTVEPGDVVDCEA